MYLKFIDDTYVNGVLTFKAGEVVKFESIASYNRWLNRHMAVEVSKPVDAPYFVPVPEYVIPEEEVPVEQEEKPVETEPSVMKASKKKQKSLVQE